MNTDVVSLRSRKYVLAIDPGLKCLGWALFCEGKLIACGVSRSKNNRHLGKCAQDHINNLLNLGIKPEVSVLLERPKIYTLTKQKGDQNDLIAIAIVGAIVSGALSMYPVEEVFPDGWKGQMPKDVCHRRIDRRLTDEETRVKETLPKAKTVRHNGLDAIGIGLFGVGRRP